MKKYIITIAILAVVGVEAWQGVNMFLSSRGTRVVDINRIENIKFELTYEVSPGVLPGGNFNLSGDIDLNFFERIQSVAGHLVDDTLYIFVLQTGGGFFQARELDHRISNIHFGDTVYDVKNFYLISGPDMVIGDTIDPSRYSEKMELTLSNQ